MDDAMDFEEIEFWRQRASDKTLLEATKTYPDRAKRFFGEKPVLRGHLVELGMILAAREILATPPGQSTFDIREIFDENIHLLIEKMNEDQKRVIKKLTSRDSQDAAAREFAAKIIESATSVS